MTCFWERAGITVFWKSNARQPSSDIYPPLARLAASCNTARFHGVAGCMKRATKLEASFLITMACSPSVTNATKWLTRCCMASSAASSLISLLKWSQ